MRNTLKVGAMGLASALYIFLVVPAGFAGQADAQAQRTMTLDDVKDRLKENKNFLKEAQNRGKAGDAAGIETALANFDRNMDGINRAMSSGYFEGTDAQREEAFDRVEKATRKHGEVLANLLTKVPEQARPHIQHAMEVSQKGRSTALSNLEQARTERQAREQAEMRRNDQAGGGMGRSDGMGRSGGMGSSASGVGGGMGRSAGAGASAGHGRH